MYVRQYLLAFFSVIIIVLFFSIGLYKDWLDTKVVKAVQEINDELTYMEPEERLAIRHGNAYAISCSIAKYIRTMYKDTSALILLPPKKYMKEHNVDYPVPEPVVFYYYTGLHALWANSSGVEKVKYAVVYAENNLKLIPVNKYRLDSLLVLFRQYNITL